LDITHTQTANAHNEIRRHQNIVTCTLSIKPVFENVELPDFYVLVFNT